jgi:nitrite reductase/ring-hydroxylating ferredoxin subunit
MKSDGIESESMWVRTSALPDLSPLDHDMSADVCIVGTGTVGLMTACLLDRDFIQGRRNAWAKLYDPARRSLRAGREFARENLNVALQCRDLITPGEVASAEQIPPGTGAILRAGLTKSSVHRDENGELHAVSANCRHLGCVVSWNAVEKSWDCPCHGSRFSTTGEVLNGPATEPRRAREPSSIRAKHAA